MKLLVEAIKTIVSTGPVDETAVAALEGVVRLAVPRLMEELHCPATPQPGRYLCYTDSTHGFVIMAMVWAPGDGTAIHDHATWGVEAVLRNELRVTSFSSSETDPQPLSSVVLGPGAVIHNLPPARDVHRVQHATGDYALSLHIYGMAMSENRSFTPGRGFEKCRLECRQWPAPALSASQCSRG